MRENISILSAKTIQIGLVLLAFLTPIFFLPTTSEFYNFNKTTLLIVGAFFLFAVWGIKMVAEGRVRITRTPLDIPLLIFLGVYILATVFSIDPVVSILGAHPVFFGSLPAVAAIVLLYFVATGNLNGTYRLATYGALALAASLLSILLIASYFGYSLINTSWASARNWTAAGNLDMLASFLAISLPLTLSLALMFKDPTTRYFTYVLVGLQLVAFALINSLFGYIVLAVAGLFILLFVPRIAITSEQRAAFMVFLAILAAVILLVNVKGLGSSILAPLISDEDKGLAITKPVRLPLSAAWQSSASSLTIRPLLGAGPSTFGMVFPSFKPISLNSVNTNNIWNIRFDQSGSGLLTLLATTGALGIIGLLLVIIFLLRAVVSFSVGSEVVQRASYIVFLEASLIAFVAGVIFFDLSPLTTVAFVLIAAGLFSTLRDWGSNLADEVDLRLVELRAGVIAAAQTATEGRASAKYNPLTYVVLIPALALFAAAAFFSAKAYQAEFFYQKAITVSQENKGKETRDHLVAAIRANTYRDTYHRALLVTDLALARSLNQKGNLSQEEQNTLLALVREAIDQGRIVTGYEGQGLGRFQVKRVPGTSTLNVANWESLATVYSNIGGQLRTDAAVHAINTFSRSIQLDPTNPRLYEALGNVYFGLGDNGNAIKNFELAVSVKPDYASAHYNLAQALKRKGDDPGRVVNELSATLQLLEDNEQNKQVRQRIEQELAEAQKELEKVRRQQGQQQTTQPLPPQTATPSANP